MANDRNGCFTCCTDTRDIIACLCNLDKQFACIEDCLGDCDDKLKSKVIACIILREISTVNAKLDRIIRCLNCPP